MTSFKPCAYSKLLSRFHLPHDYAVQVCLSSILSLTAYMAPLQLCCFLVTDSCGLFKAVSASKKIPFPPHRGSGVFLSTTVCLSLVLKVCAHVGFTQRVLYEPTPPLCPLFSQSLLLGLINLD